ncbi:YecA family protein [Thermanaeromonas sp. C210]|uniref:YecA family protein n=1 Tax=Thermanaeromonas sp. C210 TaxID=2731925 RepID=UPI00155BF271|nr:SEC-C domain-containing protein [Thermanaeromonas sp. C210]GFN23684.1 hypothetical protein TAMC210_20010 [Thermanaeromonas sp. C210]
MPIYRVERNDDCPCGSGRKYKKCCLSRVEEATRLLQRAVGPGVYTATEREVITTLGFQCGLAMGEGGTPPDPERLGRLLIEAWEEEEKALETSGPGGLEILINRLQKLLKAKEHLRSIRIPGDLLLELERAQDEGEEHLKRFIRRLSAELAARDDFVFEAIYSMAYSLHHENYADGELKTFLIGLGWFVDDNTRDFFNTAVIRATAEELEEAEDTIEEIAKEIGEGSEEEAQNKIMDLLEGNLVYGEYLYTKLLPQVRPVLKAIREGRIKLILPLYAVIQGLYGFLINAVALLPLEFLKKAIDEDMWGFGWVRECLWEKKEAECFWPELVRILKEQADRTEDKELAGAVEKLIFLVNIGVGIEKPGLVEMLYLISIYNFFAHMPVTLDGTNMSVREPEDLFDEKLIAGYTEWLKAQGREREAEYLWSQFEALAREAREKCEAGIARLAEMLSAVK